MNILRLCIPSFAFTILLAGCSTSGDQSQDASAPSVTLAENKAEKKVDVLIDGKLFTALRWPDNVFKPVLYPLVSSGGTTVTRGFPLEPREGESEDHRHQVGNWLNYGNVNGSDFWGNGHAGKRSSNGGEIKLLDIEEKSEGNGEASLVTKSIWIDSTGNELLSEKTEYHFIAEDSVRMIDRITTLTATSSEPVIFKDTKEGMFGIRVARDLELPGNKAKKSESAGPPATDTRTGNYRSSEGITGADVWSTRARWMNLYGTVGGEKISLVICDHPENISYPTYWHARNYGLFSANPLGVKDFTKGAEELNHKLSKGESLTFRYRTIIASGEHLTDQRINAYADDFAKKY